MHKIYHNNLGRDLKKVFNDDFKKKLKYNSSDIDSILKYIKKKLKNDKLALNEPQLNKKDFKEILNIIFIKISTKQINKLLININKLIQNDTIIMRGGTINMKNNSLLKNLPSNKIIFNNKGTISKYLLYAHLYNLSNNNMISFNISNNLKSMHDNTPISYYIHIKMIITISNFEINSLKDTILNINQHDEIVNNSNNDIYILNIKKKKRLGFFTSVNYIILMTNDDDIIKDTANCKEISYKIDVNLETHKSTAYIYPYINEYLINNNTDIVYLNYDNTYFNKFYLLKKINFNHTRDNSNKTTYNSNVNIRFFDKIPHLIPYNKKENTLKSPQKNDDLPSEPSALLAPTSSQQKLFDTSSIAKNMLKYYINLDPIVNKKDKTKNLIKKFQSKLN
jgi:hypothetical protein